jgi:flagellar hook assembly protein FlgD
MRFRLELPGASDVDVQALDVRGRVVRNVARGRYPAGRHELVWNAQDDRGVAARSGVYFVRARIGDFTEVRKVVLVK